MSVQSLPRSLKFTIVFTSACIATCLCFYLMFLLIAQELTAEFELDDVSYVAPSVAVREPEEKQPVREKPQKIMPLAPPPEPTGELATSRLQPELNAQRPVFGNLADLIGPEDIRLELDSPHSDLSPLLVVQPVYPLSAAMREVEGFVVVEFSVKENGAVLNPVVVNSEPELLFDEAALNAVSRFKFNPRLVGGDPVRVDNVQLKFSFSLDSLYDVELP